MDCETATCLLDLYQEDRLTPARKAEVKDHLGKCKTCAPAPAKVLSGHTTAIPEDLKKSLLKLTLDDHSAPITNAEYFSKKSGDHFVLAAVAALAVVLSMIHFGTDTVPQQSFDKTRITWSGQ